MFYERKSKNSGKEVNPPCEQCFPGILFENLDAWQVFQFAAMGPWGIDPGTVLNICATLGVQDKEECLYKVGIISQVLNSHQKNDMKGRPSGKRN